jgi:TnpA family transposase
VPISFLAAEQERRHGRYAGEPSADQLARCFHLDDADRALIATRRWDHMRLGFAVQLGTVRFLGAFLDDPADVPAGVAADLARQLGIDDPGCLARYRESRIRFQHAAEIRAQYGYREFADPAAGFRLVRWLYALCWTGSDRPGALFDRAVAWLLAHKVLLPGATVLERLVARVRARAAQRLWRAIARGVAATQRAKLDALLLPGEGGRQSAFDRLRDGPVLQSPAELGRAVKRLEEVRALAEGLPPADRVPPGRVAALARHAGAARAQAVARMPEERRAATLLAYVRTLEATAQDDVLDLFDAVVTRLSADAEAAGERARLRTLRDLDAAALRLGRACAVLLDEDTPDTAVRAAAFEAVTPDALRAAMARVVELARPEEGSPYVAELREQARRLQFLPALLRAVRFAAAPAARPVLDAVEHLRALAEGRPAGKPPLAWVPKGWRDEVVRADGGVDMAAYRVCLLPRVRAALRRRDLHTEPSLRYADPRKGLLEGAAWEAARPAVCRSLGVSSSAAEELGRLGARLDAAWREAAGLLPSSTAMRLRAGKDPGLVLAALDRLDEPPSLVALRAAAQARMPRVDLPEIVLEIHARTGFLDAFTHASEAGSRAAGLATSLSAVLLAEACNTGFEPLARADVPALRRSRLGWAKQNYMRGDTITAGNARLVAAQAAIPLARAWGGGEVASADGLRFVVPVRTVHAGPNPRYFGQGRGVTWYNLASDQYTGLGGVAVPGTLRDSLVLLAVVLEQETALQPTEVMTDTGAYADSMFGIFHLLGYRFSPRIADAGGARFWRMDRGADYGPLNGLAAHRINLRLIEQHWDDLLRLAGSLKLGVVQATGLVRTLQVKDRPTPLARALAELGRVLKTLHLLEYACDEAFRRRILGQLNRHERRHRLARVVFHGKQGELRQRYREGQEDQLGALGLVVNVVVLWNTIYLDAALDQLRAEGHGVRDEDVARLSPLGFEHVNMLGRYAFTLPDVVARGGLRPLRDPTLHDDEG